MTVVRCAEAPVPPVLAGEPRVTVDELPTREQTDALLETTGGDDRLIVCGTDAGLAALVTRLMRTDSLHVEIAYVTDSRTPATRAYGLPTGAAAAELGMAGRAEPVPLLRDDTGTAVVGAARLEGVDSAPLEGEAYADDEQLFSGTVPWVRIHPDVAEPGVVAIDGRNPVFRRRRRLRARAVQLGTPGAYVVRDGLRGRRPVKRATFYRHVDPLLLVRPGPSGPGGRPQ